MGISRVETDKLITWTWYVGNQEFFIEYDKAYFAERKARREAKKALARKK